MAKKKIAKPDTGYGDAPERITNDCFYGIKLDEQQLAFANMIWSSDYDIVFCNSKAGTGKSLIAMGTANLLVKYGRYDGIIGIVSPVEEKKQGYLPGDIFSKSSVYFQPFKQAMVKCNMDPTNDVVTDSMIDAKYGCGIVQLMTHTFTRGSTFENKVVIIDEMENYTTSEAKKVLTRCADNCKVICIGHDLQCDLEDSSASGFVKYMEHFRGKERCAVAELSHNYRGWVSQWADSLK